MGNASRKARKKAGEKFQHEQKIPTRHHKARSDEQKPLPFTVEHMLKAIEAAKIYQERLKKP